jgi:lysophospholipase L1-like esterase
MKPSRLLALLLLGVSALLPSAAPAQPAATPTTAARFQIPPTDDGLPGVGPINRQDWFQKLWTEHRSNWAHRVGEDQRAVVFLGDSITDWWGADLGGNFPGLKVANRGIAGDTTRGVLLRLQEDVLSLHPKGLVLLIGTNDLASDASPETIVGNLKLILAEVKRADPRLPVVLCQVFPSAAAKKRPAEQIRRLNELYAAAVKGDPQITLLETWPLFADAQGDAPIAEFPDQLHPNKAGYAKWAAALRPILATLGFLETTPDTFTPEPGFESLFNGRDLTGWGYRPTPPQDIAAARDWQATDPHAAAWPIVATAQEFTGRTNSPEGRYLAKNGRLVVSTPPQYRSIQALWTIRDFPGDFELRLEFRATPNADSGVFIRGPQLQCRDYRLAGPYTQLTQYKPQDWNELVVVVRGGKARCTCNGEVLEEALPVPASGPIGLEGDRGQMEYRRIRLKPLQ